MNLFWLRAAFLADTHVVKMSLEYTQLLSTAYHLHGQIPPSNYKAAHKAHPCAIWTAQSINHWLAVAQLAYDTMREYTKRFHKVHKCFPKLCLMLLKKPVFGKPPAFKDTTVLAQLGPFHDVPLCMEPQFHHRNAAVAYHRYYLHKLHTVKNCARWNRKQHRFMHYAAVISVLQLLMQQVNASRKRKIMT